MIHIQEPVPGWLEAVTKLPAKALVKAMSVQWMSEAKAANSKIYTLHRYVNDALQGVDWSDTDAIREQRAREWFNRFVDDTFLNQSTAGIPHWQGTDFISWWNEYYATGDPKTELWWKQERAAAKVWRDEYRNGPNKAKLGHIRLTIAAAPVGNNIPWQTAETAKLYDCLVDYHPYKHYTALNTVDPGDWQYHSGRWVTMDTEFRNRGFAVDWIFGEAGPYEAAETGWRHDKVLGANELAYIDSMRDWIRKIATTNAYQTGRVFGFALFTTGGGDRWKYFESKQPELNALAEMIKVEWRPGTVIPPTPTNPLPITPLSQRDPRWASHIMGPDSTGRVRTIGDFGCLVTDWCMMVRQWGISQLNPAELWEHIKAAGGTNGAYLKSGALAAAFPGKVKYNGYTGGTAGLYDQIRANKDKGWITPVRVDFNPTTPAQEEHWVNVIDYLPDDNFTAADPWTGKVITINLVYGIPGPDVLTAQWYEPITGIPPRRYNRVCHLLPGNATPDEYQRVIVEAYAARQSVMSSIDDALITHPNLTSRTVNVWGELSRHGDFTDKQSFENWVANNYPPLPVLVYREF